MMPQAWNECETAGNNYLNTYATLSSEDEDMEEDAPSTEGTPPQPCTGALPTTLNSVQHPLIHAEQLLLKVGQACHIECRAVHLVTLIQHSPHSM